MNDFVNVFLERLSICHISVLAGIAYPLILVLFCGNLFGYKYKQRSIYIIAILSEWIVNSILYIYQLSFIRIIFLTLILLIIAIFLFNSSTLLKVFLLIYYISMGLFSEILGITILSCFNVSINNITDNIYANSIYNILVLMLIYFFMLVLKAVIDRKKALIYSRELLFFLPFSVFSTMLIVALIYTVVYSKYNFIFNIVVTVTSFCIYISNFIIYYIMKSIEKMYKKENEQFTVITETNARMARLEMLNKYNEDILKINHDIKKHLYIISTYLDQNDISSAKDYLNRLNIEYNDTQISNKYSNRVIDSAVHYYSSKADSGNYTFDTEINIFEEPITIDDQNLCAILFNLLDNASHAAIKCNGYVKLSILLKSGILYINVENSYTTDRDNVSGNNIYHGLGISIVTGIINKLGGDYSYKKNNGVYSTSVILYNTLSVHSPQ